MSTYVFFWKPNELNGVFSQWYPSIFREGDLLFYNAEQYMMYHKAMLFKDVKIAKQILENSDPQQCKALGRRIRNFDEATWNEHRERIVLQGNCLKFDQNELLKKIMKEQSIDTIFVEASPLDRIWGIGYTQRNALQNINSWGLNLLGKALNETYKYIL